MKLTEKQAILLLEILRESLCLNDRGLLYSLNVEQRRKLYNELINQKSDESVELDKKEVVE